MSLLGFPWLSFSVVRHLGNCEHPQKGPIFPSRCCRGAPHSGHLKLEPAVDSESTIMSPVVQVNLRVSAASKVAFSAGVPTEMRSLSRSRS